MQQQQALQAQLLSKTNMMHCEQKLRQHLPPGPAGAAAAADPAALRVALYDAMMSVAAAATAAGGTMPPLRDLNNAVLNAARAALMQLQQQQQQPARLPPPPGPGAFGGGAGAGSVLAREAALHGPRAPLGVPPLPAPSSLEGADRAREVTDAHGRALAERHAAGVPVAPPFFSVAAPQLQQQQQQQVPDWAARPGYGTPALQPQPQQQSETVRAEPALELERRLAELSRQRDEAAAEAALRQSSRQQMLPGGGGGGDLQQQQQGGLTQNQARQLASELLAAPRYEADPASAARASMRDREQFEEQQRRLATGPLDGGREAPTTTLAPAGAVPPSAFPLAAAAAAGAPGSAVERGTREVCIAINGADRDWVLHPTRYRYSVPTGALATNALQARYRDLEWLQAAGVVLPMEILGARGEGGGGGSYPTLPGGGARPGKPFYQYEYSFGFPYLLLHVDGFDGAYDGTNDAVRRAFSVLVYQRAYKAPNGRGYVLLHPAQVDRRHFSTPLASLRDLGVSLLRPNGALFNHSVDTYTSTRVVYDPTRRLLLEVVLDQYFDRNEFNHGDHVMLRDFAVALNAAAQPSYPPPAGGGIYVFAPGFPGFAALSTFLNRAEGHEVVQITRPNDQGFYRGLQILAPGVLDQAAGRVVLDLNVLAAVRALVPPDAATPPAAQVVGAGLVLNASLQVTITLRAGLRAADLTTETVRRVL